MKTTRKQLVGPLALLLAMLAMPIKANTECDVVYEAASRGKVASVEPVVNISRGAIERLQKGSICIENFNAAAQRITMVFGGIDISPAKAYLRKTTCAAVDGAIREGQRDFKRETGIDPRKLIAPAPSPAIAPKDSGQSGSVWNRVSCALGNC